MSVHLYARLGICEIDRHDIKTAGLIDESSPREEIAGHLPDAALLPLGDRRRGATELVARARFHFHEDDSTRFARDDVDFAMLRAVAACKNCVPAPAQLGAGEIFSQFSEGLARIVLHARGQSHITRQPKTTKVTKATKNVLYDNPFVYFLNFVVHDLIATSA